MSDRSDSNPYLFSAPEGPYAAAGCSSMATLHRMGGFTARAELSQASESSDSNSQEPPASERERAHTLREEDVEMKSGGSSGSSTESTGSSNGRSKDSALLESSGSNKSSNSHSPSPPSSSNAFSLLSASSEQDNPSTSGCSSEESAKAKTQKELLKTLKELKRLLPAENRNKGSKSGTLSTLKYALRCVKQVEANEEYYQLLMINDSQPSGLDVSSYTIEEIDRITSEYTLKSNDMFAVAVSLNTGKIVYISNQAASILNCKLDVFKKAKFVEFLTPQDVSVFYSFTTPYRLPSWSMCTGAESSPSDCMQEKSFFCRISGGKDHEGDVQYYPFRMTPYLMKVQDTGHAEDQICCLLLAERVHSGYEAPRIPVDKRIFTTTHTPSCVFKDVDERAVPLLGYLPQDLIGTQVLLHLHPHDRPIMLAIHRKILQYAGQPFDHSSIRFCTRNGEYITLDTSWSSFVNPWSRKVSFVIGRHKVRMGPVNEDVFGALAVAEGKAMDSDIHEITEQIHRLLLQPVHNSGYRINERLVASSSDSNGANANAAQARPDDEELSKAKPRTFQEICKGVHMQKNQEQQSKKSPSIELLQKSAAVRPKDSAAPAFCREPAGAPLERAAGQEQLAYKDQTVYSYQQISCLDSVIGYLENCNMPVTVKRKCQSNSAARVSEEPPLLKACPGLSSLEVAKKPTALITSLCSYSSTIVHVGDKKPRPESDITEDASGELAAEGPAPPRGLEREAYGKLGLTKQVLVAHSQKEEQAFLSRFRELRGAHAFQADCGQYMETRKDRAAAGAALGARSCRQSAGSRGRTTKPKRAKQNESSDSTPSRGGRLPWAPQGLSQTSWSLSDASQPTYPAVVPTYPGAPPQRVGPSLAGFGQPNPYASPLVAPVVALVLPSYVFPQAGGTPRPPSYPAQGAFPGQHPFPVALPFGAPAVFPAPAFAFVPARQSRCSTPASPAGRDLPSPLLFQPRCSLPLQLNLPQQQERQRAAEWEGRDGSAPPAGSGASGHVRADAEDGALGDRSDSNSSSDLLDILLLPDDSRSGAGSGSNGGGTSASGASGSGTGSSRTSSNYFGSVDSSQESHWAKARGTVATAMEVDESKLFGAPRDPPWLLAADDNACQLPPRDLQQVLRQDREKLRQMQKRELVEVHPWMRRGGLPKAFNVKLCVGCENIAETLIGEESPDLHMGDTGTSEEHDITGSLLELSAQALSPSNSQPSAPSRTVSQSPVSHTDTGLRQQIQPD